MELASEKEIGLGLASKATAMWLLLLELTGGTMPCSFADIDRSMPTRSVNPYFPNRYRIIALSSMALLLLSILPNFKQMGSTGSIRGKVQGHAKARHAWFRGERTDVVSRVCEKESDLGARTR